MFLYVLALTLIFTSKFSFEQNPNLRLKLCWKHQALPCFWSNWWPKQAESWQIHQHSQPNFQVDPENSCVLWGVTTRRPYICQAYIIQEIYKYDSGLSCWCRDMNREIQYFSMVHWLLMHIRNSILLKDMKEKHSMLGSIQVATVNVLFICLRYLPTLCCLECGCRRIIVGVHFGRPKMQM